MLKITINNESGQNIRLTLEGWLIGPWVDELKQQSERALSDAKTVILDCEKLWFADLSGISLLHELARRRVTHVKCSSFIRQQLKETSV